MSYGQGPRLRRPLLANRHLSLVIGILRGLRFSSTIPSISSVFNHFNNYLVEKIDYVLDRDVE